VLAAQAPDLSTALQEAKAAGTSNLHLDGTPVRTDRISTPGPNGTDLWWSGKHRHHGGNIQVLSDGERFPMWTSDVRPGREHDTTCAKAATCGESRLLEQLEKAAAADDLLTLTDLGYENLCPAPPGQKPKGGQLTDEQKAFNQIIRGVHAVAEHANSLPKTALKSLRRVSLDPWRIGAITRAALVLLRLKHCHHNRR
jgi:hypothetical protein